MNLIYSTFAPLGEMAEWSNAAVLKTVELARVPGVRIPLSPPLARIPCKGLTLFFFARQILERCQSGRMGRSRKPLYSFEYRGFESLSLRGRKFMLPFFVNIGQKSNHRTNNMQKLSAVCAENFIDNENLSSNPNYYYLCIA